MKIDSYKDFLRVSGKFSREDEREQIKKQKVFIVLVTYSKG
jgi:hypothetical protein